MKIISRLGGMIEIRGEIYRLKPLYYVRRKAKNVLSKHFFKKKTNSKLEEM